MDYNKICIGMTGHPQQIKTMVQAAVIVLFLSSCGHGPYKGRLLDETTGQPVVGAVAVGAWTHKVSTLVDTNTECLDAREAVSDDKGEFTIPTSLYGEFFGSMSIAIYKVGYERIVCPWESLRIWGGCMIEPAEWDGNRAIILFNPVVKDRLRYDGSPPSRGCGRRDGQPLTQWDNEEEEFNRAIGIKP